MGKGLGYGRIDHDPCAPVHVQISRSPLPGPIMSSTSIAWFSGTGNSFDAARVIATAIDETGGKVRLVSIESGDQPGPPPVPDGSCLVAEAADRIPPDPLILVFPVYAWGPPALVRRWIRALPRACGDAVAGVLAVDGGEGAGAAASASRMLARKGYRVRLSARAGYPENWREMSPPPAAEAGVVLLGRGRNEALVFARRWLTGDEARYQRPMLGALGHFAGVLFRGAGRQILGQCFVADDRCTSCRLCERTCPVGAINLNGVTGRPEWSMRCESCNRCINVCPESAIGTSTLRTVLAIGGSLALVVLGARLAGILADVFAPSLPGAARALAVVVGGLGGQALYIAGAVPLVRTVFRLPSLRRATAWTFNRHWPRYLAPGYHPPRHRR